MMPAGQGAESRDLVVVTGLSGAGRSTALRLLEDLGYFCVDNIPPPMIPELIERGGDALPRVALGIDVRTGNFLDGSEKVIDDLMAGGHRVEVIFLEARDDELVRRFSETRRPHPLATSGDLLEGIRLERERVAPLRDRAGFVIDTTGRSVHDLRRQLRDHMARSAGRARMVTRVVSFGFKFGLPVEADLVFDLRFLPNPHFVPELKPLTGLDEPVAEFVMGQAEARRLLDELYGLLGWLLARYEHEGKAYLTIAVGCTGGRHRSVAFAEALAARLRQEREVVVEHRGIEVEPS